MLNEAASSCSSSLFTFPNTMSACFSEAASNIGAKPLHGPHQGAQKSTRTMSLPFTTCSKLRSEEHTSELQSLAYLVCRLLLEKKKNKTRESIEHSQDM